MQSLVLFSLMVLSSLIGVALSIAMMIVHGFTPVNLIGIGYFVSHAVLSGWCAWQVYYRLRPAC